MNANDPEKLFLEKVKDLMDQGAENLGSQTERQLEDIRRRALDAAAERRWRFSLSTRWIMAGGFATAALAGVALFFWLSASPGDFPAGPLEDLEIIASKERVDFYQNLEFYRWLATKANRVTTNGKGS